MISRVVIGFGWWVVMLGALEREVVRKREESQAKA
jgi:hypothetical protein